MHKFVSILRSRLPVLAGVAAVVLALLVGVYIKGSLYGAWKMLGILALSPTFADTRTVTHSIDCLLTGQNPYVVRTFDPWHRVYNYPPIWLDLRYVGVTSRASNLLGTTLAAMTASTFLVLFRARTWAGAVIIFFAVMSRTVLFAVERGNTDQAIFFLLIFGFFLINRQNVKVRTFLKGSLIVLLTVLKIFPITAVVVLIRNRKAVFIALLIAVLSVAALAVTARPHLSEILANTPQDVILSFGTWPFFVAAGDHTTHFLAQLIRHHPKIANLGSMLLAVLSVTAGISYREKLNRFLPPLDFDQARGSIAVAGLAIFCFTFLRGSSYDYRLLFLLGTLAYLVNDLNDNKSLRSLPAAILLLLLLWKPPALSLIFEIVDCLVFVGSCAWLGTSLFDRLALTLHTVAPSPEATQH